MPQLVLRASESCRWDCVSLGEVMLRLDPGEGRIRTAREFKVWEGGGEYNVARGLRRCFGLKTAVATAFADNDVGRLLEDFILQGGVEQHFIKWVKFDGVGRTVRNGLNFTERGFGVRGAVGFSDRGNTAAASSSPATSIGTTSSANSACAGCTPAASSRVVATPRRSSSTEAWKPRKKHGTIVSLRFELSPLALEIHRRPEARAGSEREMRRTWT